MAASAASAVPKDEVEVVLHLESPEMKLHIGEDSNKGGNAVAIEIKADHRVSDLTFTIDLHKGCVMSNKTDRPWVSPLVLKTKIGYVDVMHKGKPVMRRGQKVQLKKKFVAFAQKIAYNDPAAPCEIGPFILLRLATSESWWDGTSQNCVQHLGTVTVAYTDSMGMGQKVSAEIKVDRKIDCEGDDDPDEYMQKALKVSPYVGPDPTIAEFGGGPNCHSCRTGTHLVPFVGIPGVGTPTWHNTSSVLMYAMSYCKGCSPAALDSICESCWGRKQIFKLEGTTTKFYCTDCHPDHPKTGRCPLTEEQEYAVMGWGLW